MDKYKAVMELLNHGMPATVTENAPICTEILSEEALEYIEAVRKIAYDQGYFEGYTRGVEEMKSRIEKEVKE